jgi:hypothetical protein
MVFVDVSIHFRIWTRIWNPRVTDPDPAKVPDPCGSGSTALSDPMSLCPEQCPNRSVNLRENPLTANCLSFFFFCQKPSYVWQPDRYFDVSPPFFPLHCRDSRWCVMGSDNQSLASHVVAAKFLQFFSCRTSSASCPTIFFLRKISSCRHGDDTSGL